MKPLSRFMTKFTCPKSCDRPLPASDLPGWVAALQSGCSRHCPAILQSMPDPTIALLYTLVALGAVNG